MVEEDDGFVIESFATLPQFQSSEDAHLQSIHHLEPIITWFLWWKVVR
jgi:hypothetical protein